MPHPLSLATEGLDDEAAARKICSVLGIPVSASYPLGGKSKLDPKIPSYNRAAAIAPWLVLRDLDADAPCPSELCGRLIAERAPALLLRIPVKSIESWLLADPISLSAFLGISQSLIPLSPEVLPSPKLTIVNLARRSRKRGVQAMVPQHSRPLHQGPPPVVWPLRSDNTLPANTR